MSIHKRQIVSGLSLTSLCCIAAFAFLPGIAYAQSYALKTLVTFEGPNGAYPDAGFSYDSSGNAVSTTYEGGAYGVGTIYKLAAGTNAFSTIASFNIDDGVFPAAGVTIDDFGNIFGTTEFGGAYSDGIAYEVPAGTNTITPLETFDGSNGYWLFGGLTPDSNGNLYGCALYGGQNGDGTVFEIAAGSHAFSTIASFNGANGVAPNCNVTLDGQGNIYGVTQVGGAYNAGTVFEIPAGSGQINTIVNFNGINGAIPFSSLTPDSHGNLYGITANGGVYNDGTLFEIAAGSNEFSTVVNFNGVNGANPRSAVMLDSSDNIYGATVNGGDLTLNNGTGYGTIFKIAAGSSVITTITTFNGANGATPFANLTLDKNGNLYGAAFYGGDLTLNNGNGEGTLFELIPGPVITGFTPGSGPVGTTVTINGAGFTGATSVKFNGIRARYTVGSDYSITATVPAGAVTGPITVTLPGGTLASPTNFTVIPLTVTGLSFNPSTIPAGTSTIGAVTLNTVTPIGASVAISLDGFAYRTVTVPANASSANFTITLPSDTTPGAYTFTASYGSSSEPATLTITSPITVASLTFNPTTINAGASTLGTVTLSAPAVANASIAIERDGIRVTTATVKAGATTGTFPLSTSAKTAPGVYTFTADYQGSSASAALTIASPITVTSLAFSPSTISAGGSSVGTVTLSAAPVANVAVAITQHGILVATVTIKAGATTGTFTVTPDASTPAGSYSYTATYLTSSACGVLTITNQIAVTSLTFNPSTIAPGKSTIGTVTLSAAPTANASVSISVNGFPIATATVKAGATTGTFTLATSTATAAGTYTFTAEYLGTSASGSLTVN